MSLATSSYMPVSDMPLKTFRLIFEHVPQAMLILHPHSLRVLEVNPATCDLLGYQPEDFLALNFDRIVADPALMSQVKRGEVRNFEVLARNRSGLEFWAELDAVALPVTEGERILCVLRDVSDRKVRYAALDRFVTVVEQMPDLVAMADATGQLLFLNNAGRELLGWQAEDYKRLFLTDFHPTWARDALISHHLGEAVKQGRWLGETALVKKTNQELPAFQAIMVHKNADGTTQYFSTVIRDTSQLKINEQQLRRARDNAENANLLKGRFLTNICGEFDKSLNRITSALDLLTLTTVLTEDQQQYTKLLQGSTRRMSGMIAEVSSYVKHELDIML